MNAPLPRLSRLQQLIDQLGRSLATRFAQYLQEQSCKHARLTTRILSNSEGNPYLWKGYITPRTAQGERGALPFTLALHRFFRSDEHLGVLHDHPWDNLSFILSGGYWEHLKGGRRQWRAPGSVLFRRAETCHAIEIQPCSAPVWTLFLTGPSRREWGFRLDRGQGEWVPWQQHVDERQTHPMTESSADV